MGRILLEGLWPVNPHLDPKAFTAFTLHLAVSAATNNNHSVVIGKKIAIGSYIYLFIIRMPIFIIQKRKFLNFRYVEHVAVQ